MRQSVNDKGVGIIEDDISFPMIILKWVESNQSNKKCMGLRVTMDYSSPTIIPKHLQNNFVEMYDLSIIQNSCRVLYNNILYKIKMILVWCNVR